MGTKGGSANERAVPGQSAPTQRIDIFLWYARLLGSRSAAQALAERGIIRLNGRRIDRAHAPVRAGDLLTLPVAGVVRIVRILALPHRRGPATEARLCYEPIEAGGDVAQSMG